MSKRLFFIYNLLSWLLNLFILRQESSFAEINRPNQQKINADITEAESSLSYDFPSELSRFDLLIETESIPESKLSKILDTINQMDDNYTKAKLLYYVAIRNIQLTEEQEAASILEKCLNIAEKLNNPENKVDLLVAIAQAYGNLNKYNQAQKILILATESANTVKDQLIKGQLLLEITLGYDLTGLEAPTEDLFSQSQTIIEETIKPPPAFPFSELPDTLKLGLAGNINSFRDTTAFVQVTANYYKQWSTNDISLDSILSVSLDTSRTVNNYRPSSLIEIIYRSHIDQKWSFFSDIFIVTNQELFASRNDDEDLTIIATGLVGAGLNLWRGDTPRQFLDVQFGIGPRYEYDFIQFEERENRISPVFGFVLLGRNFQLGRFSVDETFAIVPNINDFGRLTISSDTKVSFLIDNNWSFVNRLFIRSRNPEVFEENPAIEFFFTTGINYQF